MEDLKNELSVKEIELISANEYSDSLTARYSDSGVTDKNRQQCSLCHLRTGHTKRSCPNGPCQSARQCTDVEKHPDEKRFLGEASENKRKILKEIQKIQSDITAKQKLIEQVTGTFSSKIRSYLVNSDIDRYTFKNDSGPGRLLKTQKVLNDTYILEQHYKGRVPKDLDKESKKWQTLIKEHNDSFKKMTLKKVREKDPIKKKLEDNDQYPVTFPKYQTEPVQQAQQQPQDFWHSRIMTPWAMPWAFSPMPNYMYTTPETTTSASRVGTPSSTLTYSEYLSQQQWSPPLPNEMPPQNPPPPQDDLYDDELQINQSL